MALKRAIINTEKVSKNILKKIEKSVRRVLATYPKNIIAEADENQINALKGQGLEVEVQEEAQVIRLKAVEIDTTKKYPSLPSSFKLRDIDVKKDGRNYWIVQFVGPAKPEWGDMLRDLGGKLLNYVPENAYLTEMTPQVMEKVKALEFINWVGPYEPIYKVSPLLMGHRLPALRDEIATRLIQTKSFQPKPEGNLTIILHRSSDQEKINKTIKNEGGTVIKADGDTIIASIDPSAIEKIAKMSEVKWIEPYLKPEFTNNMSAPIIGVQDSWNNHDLDGEGQIVSVADTGLDTGVNDATMHDDFEGRILNIHDLSGDGADDSGIHESVGHGTHVAGSVLGNGSRSNGTIRGMAPKALLVFQKIVAKNGFFHLPADLNQLFQQAYDDGARIHSNSWGTSYHGQYLAYSQDIDEFMWNHKASMILFSAANDGIDADKNGVVDFDSLRMEACAKNCVTVGATEGNRPPGSIPKPGWDGNYGYPAPPIKNDHVSDNPDGMAAFSSRGPTDDGRLKPDVVAPGTNILSVRSSLAPAGLLWGDLDAGNPLYGLYCWSGGTSMSTPLTAGTVAIIRQYLMGMYPQNNVSGALLKAILIHGAVSIEGQYTPSEAGTAPNSNQGWGRVNLQNSLFPLFPVSWQFQDNPADAVGSGDDRDYAFQVVDSTVPFRATLVWTDFPSDPSSSIGIVNELSLSVIDPNGSTTQGTPANNNVQQVSINPPQVGNYTVRVSGINVRTQINIGQLQDFALVVSAGLEFVDVYIKDNAKDDGIPPSSGCVFQSPDIWVSLDNDPNAPPVENPEPGQTNFVFVKVHNRGSKDADNAEVTLYWANPGTNLSRPYWMTDGISVDGQAGNKRYVSVQARNTTGDGEATTAAFEWIPPDPKKNQLEPGHFCLFAEVNHPDDPIRLEDMQYVRWEDNLAWKNIVENPSVQNSSTSMEFYIAGVKGASSISDIKIDRTALPKGGNVKLKIPTKFLQGTTVENLDKVWESAGHKACEVQVTSDTSGEIKGIKLKSNENELARLEVSLPKDIPPGEVYPVFVEQRVNGVVTGRVTLAARVVGTPAFIANASSGEIHLSDCDWVKKMSGRNKVPYDDIDSAIRRGYNGCRFCLPDYDRPD